MDIFLQELQKDYYNENIVPFIGAGLSVPFKVPTWKDLILSLTNKYAKGNLEFIKKAVEFELNNHDYWGAIDTLKRYAPIDEQDIQESIVELIQEKQIKLEDDLLHNYYDLSRMNFKFYLTTNYENILQQYLAFDFQPILLKDVLFNTQDMLNQKRVCQLHGTLSNAGTIVLSKKSYEELYNDKKYDDLLKLVTGSKKILFMGFSFDDQFIRTLIKEHKKSFNGKHYILLNNPSDLQMKELRTEYGLLTIPYNVENSTHTLEIRKILDKISQTSMPETEETTHNVSLQSSSSVIVGAGLSSLKQNVEGNLFFKKLKLENINSSLIELSSAFFIAAEEYIREMRKLGMPVDVIDLILGQVFLEYKEQYINIYDEYGNSEQFLKEVHKSLANIDLGRYNKFLNDNESNKNENRGFVHILANNEEEDIWWGKERFNESTEE